MLETYLTVPNARLTAWSLAMYFIVGRTKLMKHYCTSKMEKMGTRLDYNDPDPTHGDSIHLKHPIKLVTSKFAVCVGTELCSGVVA